MKITPAEYRERMERDLSKYRTGVRDCAPQDWEHFDAKIQTLKKQIELFDQIEFEQEPVDLPRQGTPVGVENVEKVSERLPDAGIMELEGVGKILAFLRKDSMNSLIETLETCLSSEGSIKDAKRELALASDGYSDLFYGNTSGDAMAKRLIVFIRKSLKTLEGK